MQPSRRSQTTCNTFRYDHDSLLSPVLFQIRVASETRVHFTWHRFNAFKHLAEYLRHRFPELPSLQPAGRREKRRLHICFHELSCPGFKCAVVNVWKWLKMFPADMHFITALQSLHQNPCQVICGRGRWRWCIIPPFWKSGSKAWLHSFMLPWWWIQQWRRGKSLQRFAASNSIGRF